MCKEKSLRQEEAGNRNHLWEGLDVRSNRFQSNHYKYFQKTKENYD